MPNPLMARIHKASTQPLIQTTASPKSKFHRMASSWSETEIELGPAGFWSEVFDGLAPVEVGQPLLVHHDEKEAEDDKRYVCDVYEMVHRTERRQ